ncbi:MAG: hypothetical protein U9Q74_15775, partial [Gemmatimonadota bacterium]|nr:hypothetical protein [Gemmatimonadota bacterium]
QRIAAITLRRTKRDALAELPPVIDTNIWLEFDKEQRAIYDDVRESVDRVLGQEVARVAFGIPGAQQRAVRTDPVVAQAVSLVEGVETADALFRRVASKASTANSGY